MVAAAPDSRHASAEERRPVIPTARTPSARAASTSSGVSPIKTVSSRGTSPARARAIGTSSGRRSAAEPNAPSPARRPPRARARDAAEPRGEVAAEAAQRQLAARDRLEVPGQQRERVPGGAPPAADPGGALGGG